MIGSSQVEDNLIMSNLQSTYAETFGYELAGTGLGGLTGAIAGSLQISSTTTIEGNTCSYFDTVLLLTEGLTPAGKQLNEVYEIVGHDKAIKLLLNYAQSKTALSEDVICALYKEVIFPVVHTNSYRKSEVYIRGATHSVVDPAHIYQELKFFVADLSTKNFS